MKLSKKGMYYKTLSRTGAIIAAITIFFPPALLLALPMLLIVGAYEYLYWINFEFYFEEDDIKIKSGVLSRTELDIPVRRVQDVDTSRNIVQRMLGIAKVNIKTAGSDIPQSALKYLEEDQAEELRQKIRQLKSRRDTEDEMKDEVSEENSAAESFYDIGDALMTYSLVSGVQNIVFLAVLGLIFGIGLSAFIAESTIQMLGYSIAVILLLTISSLVLLASGTFNTFMRYYDFKVERRGDTFEYERGLLNKQGGSIPLEKIQKIEITENFLMRYFGYASLKAETAGYGSRQEGRSTSTKVLIPLDKTENVYQHARNLSGFQAEDMNNITERARKRYFRRFSIIAGVGLAITSILIYIGFHPALIVLPMTGFVSAKKAANEKWKNIGYSLGDKNLMMVKGFWNRKTYITEYFRFQNLVVSESIFQRRWNLATLMVDTAGDKVVNPQIPDMDRKEAFELRQQLHEKFKQSIY